MAKLSPILTFVLALALCFQIYSATGDSEYNDTTSTEDDSQEIGDEITTILTNIQNNYDKRVRPNFGGKPVVVGVTMYFVSISSISEVDMDFTVDFYFRQVWKDFRLKYKGPPGVSMVNLGSEFINTFWVPDTFFINEKRSYFHTATIPNERFQLSENGDVTRSTRWTVTAACPMDLSYFPMDTQRCSLKIESYGNMMTDIEYKWLNGSKSVAIASDVSLPQFRVLGYKQQETEINLSGDLYSRLGCEILFGRSLGYYLIQIYIPSGLNVVISWLSFWLSRNAITARVALGVTTVLTMATLMSSTNASLPKISYIKSIDVYLAACFLMVFSSLLENAVVGYMKKRIQVQIREYLSKEQKLVRENALSQENEDDDDEENSKMCSNTDEEVLKHLNELNKDISQLEKIWGLTPFIIDKYSRAIFPISFVFFNLAYWLIYLRISEVSTDDLIYIEA